MRLWPRLVLTFLLKRINVQAADDCEKRFGFQTVKDTDKDQIYSVCLDLMSDMGIDFVHFFRKLSLLPISEMESEDSRVQAARLFFNPTSSFDMVGGEERGKKKLAAWLGTWRERLSQEDGGLDDERRRKAMKAVNPKVSPCLINLLFIYATKRSS